MGSLLATLGLGEWWAGTDEPKAKTGTANLAAKIEAFEHDAIIAGLRQQDCRREAVELLATGDQDTARQRFAHAQSYKAQSLSLLRAVTAMHAQQLSIATHENNIRILETLKDTAKRVHHSNLDPNLVDRITEDLNDANDHANVNSGVMDALGDELAPMQDDAWEQFLAEQQPSGPIPRNVPDEPVEPFPSAPTGLLPDVAPAEPTAPLCTKCGKANCEKCRSDAGAAAELVM
jgi:hypothetical protein